MKSDIEVVLARYDIRDRATLAQFQSMLREIAVFETDEPGFNKANRLYREYLDKPALKVWTGTVDGARFAALSRAKGGSAALRTAFAAELTSRLATLDWSVTGQTVKERYRSRALASPALRRASLVEALQPTVDAGGSLDMPSLAGLLATVNDVKQLIPLADAERAAEKAWIDKNDRVKPDIWSLRDVTLQNRGLTPVMIGIWDSGVDTDVFPSIAWSNPKELLNGKDDDGNGLIDDIHGIAIDVNGEHVSNTLLTIPPELAGEFKRIELIGRGQSELQAGLDTPATRQTIQFFRAGSAEEIQSVLNGLGWYGSYSHGTHVTGIAVKGNPAARVLVARTAFDWRSPPRRPTETTARAFAKAHQDAVDYFNRAAGTLRRTRWRQGDPVRCRRRQCQRQR
jgi:hypothetical protein